MSNEAQAPEGQAPEGQQPQVLDLTQESNDESVTISQAPTKFRLGQTLRDVVSGFEGLAIQMSENINGNIQFALQPKKKADAEGYPDAMFIDHHMLEFVDDGVSDRVTEAVDMNDIILGAKVQDIATGFKGVAIEKATYMNGCIGYAVLPKMDKKNLLGGNPRACMIDQARLQVIGAGIIEEYTHPVANEAGVVPGGPARKVTQRSL